MPTVAKRDAPVPKLPEVTPAELEAPSLPQNRYDLADRPPPASDATAELAPVTTDPDGLPMPSTLLRRFGGRRFHAGEHARIAFVGGSRLVAFERSAAGTDVVARDLATDKTLYKLPGASGVKGVGDRLVARGWTEVSLFDVKTGAEAGQVQTSNAHWALVGTDVVVEDKGAVVALRPGGGRRRLAKMKADERVVVIEANRKTAAAIRIRREPQKGEETERLVLVDVKTGAQREVDLGKAGYDTQVRVAGDGAALVMRNRKIERVEPSGTRPPRLIRSVKGYRGVRFVAGDTLGAVAVERRVTVFRLVDGLVQRELTLPASVEQMVFDDGDDELAVLVERGDVARFDLVKGRKIPSPPGHASLAAAHLDRKGALAITAGSRVDVWDVKAGRHVRGKEATKPIADARIVDDDTAVVIDAAGKARWVDLDSLVESEVADHDPGARLPRLDVYRGRVAIGTGQASGVAVYGTDQAKQFDVGGVHRGFRFGPHGQLAVAGSEHLSVYDAEGRLVWRMLQPWAERSRSLRDSEEAKLAFSPSGRRLAAAHGDRVEVWDLKASRVIRSERQKWVSAVAFVEDDVLLVGRPSAVDVIAVDHGGTAELWASRSPIEAIQVNARGVLVGSEDGTTVMLSRAAVPAPPVPATKPVAPSFTDVGQLAGADRLEVYAGYGGKFSVCVRQGAQLSCWGDNRFGRLGFEDQKARPQPTALALSDVATLGIEYRLGCALAAGRWWCWGSLDAQQLLDPRRKTPIAPTVTLGLAEPLRGGATYEDGWCVIDAAGEVVCTKRSRARYGAVKRSRGSIVGVHAATIVARGQHHGCAIDEVGEVWCWGQRNTQGQLGAGQVSPDAPDHAVKVGGLRGKAVGLAAGRDHTCAQLASGEVACWGAGGDGEIGDGTLADRPVATLVQGPTDVIRVDAHEQGTCALTTSGDLWCWGRWRQLGLLDRPRKIAGVTDVVDVDVTRYGFCVLVRDGTARCVADRTKASPTMPFPLVP